MTDKQSPIAREYSDIFVQPKSDLIKDKLLYLLIFFILVFSSFLITKYQIYRFNQSLQIPLVNLLADPSLYPNDPFAATLPYYSSKLWPLVANGIRYIPLEILFFGIFLLERILVIYAAGNLARVFAPNSWLAPVGAMILFALGIKPILGDGTIVLNYLEQTGLSIPFFLLALALFYQSRPIFWAICLAIGFNLNSMYGVYAITYCGGFFLLDVNYRKAWKKWVTAFGLFLLLASPAILLTLSAFGRNSGNNKLWLIASNLFYPWHFYPHLWKPEIVAQFFILIGLVVTLLYQNKHKQEKLFKFVATSACLSIIWLIYAVVAAYVAKSPSMLVMHPARATDFWYCIAGIALVSICAIGFEENRTSQRRSIYLAAFAASILIWHPIINPYIMGVFLITLILKPVRYFLLGRESSKYVALALTLVVLFIGVTSFRSSIAKAGSIQNAFIRRPPYMVEEVSNWARVNTSKDALFLTPPDVDEWRHFRALAKRPAFVNWQDGAAILWYRPFAEVWAERLKVLGLDITQAELDHWKARAKLRELYAKLQDEDVKRLQLRFSLDYWIVPLKHASKFPVVFQNQSYKILDLNQTEL